MYPAYPVATVAAARVASHFSGRHGPVHPSAVPDQDTIETIVDAAFWTSLRSEEGFSPRVSLAFVGPEQTPAPLTFERSIPLSPPALTRLAPAVERPGIHLGVHREDGELRVWGATRRLPAFCFVLEVISPGVLVVKHSRAEKSGKFVNVAVISGDRIKVIDQHAAATPDCPSVISSLLGLDSDFARPEDINVLIQLAVSMREHRRGGLLLVTPSGTDAWKESILQPITYGIAPAFDGLAALMSPERERTPAWEESLHRAVEALAGLTAVDGATIIDAGYRVLAFGAKIVRRRGSPLVPRLRLTEPVEGTEARIAEPSEIGGTRHLSAAQFAHDQNDALALVASQDGRFTVFGWSACEQMVHARRIESLLL